MFCCLRTVGKFASAANRSEIRCAALCRTVVRNRAIAYALPKSLCIGCDGVL
ncbi:hypothetical protein [Neisseria sicca]|uniref:hypothetical protein n=1 Tax=Neisseria sicca TaxID=490 RepID=UPI0021BED3A8|nr:hypothetical protein [Neisseria sicca]